MRKRLYIVLIIISIGLATPAQNKKRQFRSINTLGLLIGQNSSDIALESVNGFVYNNLFSGIGFGIDYYHYNSYPVFFDQRIFFDRQKNAFVYGDLGYDFASNHNKPGKEIYYYSTYDFNGGVYAGLGVGYRIKMAKTSYITFSSGFSYKEISNKVGTVNPCLVGPCPVDYSNYKYGNGRAVLKAGIDF